MDSIILHTGIARHDGDWNWQNVRSPFARIYYIVEGSADIVFYNKTCRLSPGNLYFVPPFTTHSNHCDGRFTHYYIHLYESTGEMFEDYNFPCEIKAEDIDKRLFERLCLINIGKKLPESNPKSYDNPAILLQSVTDDQTNSLAIKMESNGIVNILLSRFLTKAIRTKMSHDNRLRHIRKFIRENLDKSISIDSLAKMAHLSKDHFIHLFKSEYGESPLQYINHRKIELAETKLFTTQQNVKEIAYSLGFSDDSYFTRLFRQTTGTTPVSYRKSAIKTKQ